MSELEEGDRIILRNCDRAVKGTLVDFADFDRNIVEIRLDGLKIRVYVSIDDIEKLETKEEPFGYFGNGIWL